MCNHQACFCTSVVVHKQLHSSHIHRCQRTGCHPHWAQNRPDNWVKWCIGSLRWCWSISDCVHKDSSAHTHWYLWHIGFSMREMSGYNWMRIDEERKTQVEGGKIQFRHIFTFSLFILSDRKRVVVRRKKPFRDSAIFKIEKAHQCDKSGMMREKEKNREKATGGAAAAWWDLMEQYLVPESLATFRCWCWKIVLCVFCLAREHKKIIGETETVPTEPAAWIN